VFLSEFDLFFFLGIIDVGFLNRHKVVESKFMDLFSKGLGGNMSWNDIADLAQFGLAIGFKG
jgi:hypothetical protein